jgi:eukaryotic-like serine/threonine-protein kinase
MPLPPNTRLGRYEIRSQIGAGGMGEVYLAQDTSELGRAVALKILPTEVAADKDRLQRFTQEARTVSNLNHPNILTVYEFGRTDSASFMATEYVDGVTLREHLSRRRLKLADVLDVAIQIVAALNAAHEAGVTHRDLKPENVMVRRDQIVKVLDFGLAKPTAKATAQRVDSEAGTKVLVQTEPGLVMGTVGYMSPEQSSGAAVDQRADIWSVGVVLYEMIAGRLPFQGKDIHRQIIAIQEAEPAPLSQQVEGVPERLEEIVVKCLAKDKDERYQTARDLLIDLRNLRRKLDVEAEIERTVAPELRATSGGASGAGTRGTQTGAGATDAAQSHPTSSAEYLVTGIGRHKLAAAVALLAIALGVAGLALFLRAPGAGSAIDSVAVLPFENGSGSADSEYLSDGLAESLIYRLSQVSSVKVSPRSSVFRYKGQAMDVEKIGNELGVDAVMSGRLIQRGDNLTISVDLVDVRNRKTLWGEQFERKMSDLQTTQREIAAAIAEKLQVRLSGNDSKEITKQYTSDSEAYQLYLQGRYFWNKRSSGNLKKATELLRAATEKDPNFALAYAGLADCYAISYYYVGERPRELMPLAKTYAAKAIELDPTLAEPHVTLAFVTWLLDWDKAAAEKGFLRAIELNPNYPTAHHWYSRFLRGTGRPDEAFREIKRAEELDPLSLVIINNIAENHIDRGDLNSAAGECRRMIDLDPNFWAAHQTLGILLVRQGRYPEALAEAERSALLAGRSNVSLALLGHVYARLGRRSEAEAVIKELEKRYADRQADGRDLAVVYAGLGDKDGAFAWLQKAFEDRSVFLVFLKLEPLMEPLHADARWNALERRVGVSG